MNTKTGIAVSNVHVRNPKAVAIVNRRAQRDHIRAATAAALIILESQNKPIQNMPDRRNSQANSRSNFLDEVVEK